MANFEPRGLGGCYVINKLDCESISKMVLHTAGTCAVAGSLLFEIVQAQILIYGQAHCSSSTHLSVQTPSAKVTIVHTELSLLNFLGVNR
jgi:hypothetical protein